MSKIMPDEYKFKILILGDGGVGKSSLLLKFTDDQFSNSCPATLGIDYKSKIMCLHPNSIVHLQIWDTAGQERFRSITAGYFRSADGVILAYDCTDRASFNNISKWIKSMRNNCKENAVVIIVATKCDMHMKRTVNAEDGLNVADGIKFLETSAKTGLNVEVIFHYIAHELIKIKKIAEQSNGLISLETDSDSGEIDKNASSCPCN